MDDGQPKVHAAGLLVPARWRYCTDGGAASDAGHVLLLATAARTQTVAANLALPAVQACADVRSLLFVLPLGHVVLEFKKKNSF